MTSFLPNREIEIPLSRANERAKEYNRVVLSRLLTQIENLKWVEDSSEYNQAYNKACKDVKALIQEELKR